MGSNPEITNIISLQLIADYDAQTVQIVFLGPDDKALTIRLHGHGIIELKNAINDFLDENPEILSWKSAPIH